jgi:hypothetical protein
MTISKRRALHIAIGAIALVFTAAGSALASPPLNAGIRFKVPSAVSSPDLVTATVPAWVYWTQGTSSTTGVSCCSNEVYDDVARSSIATTSASKVGVTLVANNAYRFGIDSFDANGKYVGSVFTDPPFDDYIQQLGLIDDTSNYGYVGTWSTRTDANNLGGSSQYSTTAGASATYATNGARAFAWITTTGPTHGSAKIYIDGVYQKTVSTYSATVQYRRVVFARDWNEFFPPSHTIKIVNVATSGHPEVDVDAAGVLGED